MNQLEMHPLSKIVGEYSPPGDKSISHRLAMLGAIGEGESQFSRFLAADDCLRTIQAFQVMGVKFDLKEGTNNGGMTNLNVWGVGLQGLKKAPQELNLGNSGTSMRLLLGILAGQPFETHLIGDRSLCRRPMRRVTEPLRRMGAQIQGREDANFAPLTIRGGSLSGINWQNEIPSAQVKSAVLLAGLYAEGETTVMETIPSRDHTERLLQVFDAPIKKSSYTTSVRKAKRLKAIHYDVPGDISSAAFFIVAALLVPDSDLMVQGVGLNPTRIGLIEILKSMGANLEVKVTEDCGEPVGEIRARTSHLKGCAITKNLIPKLIDELPILMVASALAEGTSVIQGAEELRVKETDRIRSMAVGLNAIGGKISEHSDGCIINGVQGFEGGVVSSLGDHRTAMSFLIAGLRSKRGVTVQETDCIQTSYPGFMSDLGAISRD